MIEFLSLIGCPYPNHLRNNMEWISVKDRLPPYNQPFLSYNHSLIEIMEWKERILDGKSKGWFGFYNACVCCSGFCSDEFQYWMPLPAPPTELIENGLGNDENGKQLSKSYLDRINDIIIAMRLKK